MSEQNNNFEIKDEQLKKVSGGISISYNRLDVGDVFKQCDMFYFVVSKTINGPFSDDSMIAIRPFQMTDSNKLVPMKNQDDLVSYNFLIRFTYMPSLSDPNLIQN